MEKYKEKSVYRILDEITACITSIKKKLISEGFDGDKLELSLYGISAGAQLILLYGLGYQGNDVIPIKYLMNAVGPVSCDLNYWYKPAINNGTFDEDIFISVEELKKQIEAKTIIPIEPEFVVRIMNSMAGRIISQQQLDKLVVNGEVKTDSEDYKKIYSLAKYGFPIEVIKDNLLPMLCLYGGNDNLVGLMHYSYLKEAYEKNGGKDKIELIYMQDAGHERFYHGIQRDFDAMQRMHYKMVEYAKQYFTSD